MIFLASAVNLGGLWNSFGSAASSASTYFFYGLGIFIVVGLIAWVIFKWYQNSVFYKVPVSLTIIMDNGTEKTRHDLRGGTFMNRGVRDFKIKIPKTRKPHTLGYMPDLSMADADGRIKFTTTGDRTIWQQYESKWKLKEEIRDENGKVFQWDLINIPVPRETKQLTINAIKNWRDTIDKAKLTAFGIAIGGFIIMVIAHLISLFIQTRIKCGT